MIKRRVLMKQAKKARADHLVKCSLMLGRRKILKKPLSEFFVNGNFKTERGMAKRTAKAL